MQFDLKRPCRDCPFLVETSMVLAPGRMTGIAEALRSDWTVFPCHKFTHRRDSQEDDEGAEDDEGGYVYDGTEQACMGALAFTLREYRMTPVLARLACLRGALDLDTIRANFDAVEAPGKWPTDRDR